MAKKTFLQPFLTIGFLVGIVFVVLNILPVPWQKRISPLKEVNDLVQVWEEVMQGSKIAYWIDRDKASIHIEVKDRAKVLALQEIFSKKGFDLILTRNELQLKCKDKSGIFLRVQYGAE